MVVCADNMDSSFKVHFTFIFQFGAEFFVIIVEVDIIIPLL